MAIGGTAKNPTSANSDNQADHPERDLEQLLADAAHGLACAAGTTRPAIARPTCVKTGGSGISSPLWIESSSRSPRHPRQMTSDYGQKYTAGTAAPSYDDKINRIRLRALAPSTGAAPLSQFRGNVQPIRLRLFQCRVRCADGAFRPRGRPVQVLGQPALGAARPAARVGQSRASVAPALRVGPRNRAQSRRRHPRDHPARDRFARSRRSRSPAPASSRAAASAVA